MSRKGRMPIPLPKGVEVKVANSQVSVKGPKGTLTQAIVPGVDVKVNGEEIIVSVNDTTRKLRSLHGLYRTLIANMIQGATKGYEVALEMQGVGYRAAVQGQMLDLQIGTSHPTQLRIPDGIKVSVDKSTMLKLESHDKQRLGQFAAEVRGMKPPEPYQGKGIRYVGEHVRRKAGKAAKTAAAK